MKKGKTGATPEKQGVPVKYLVRLVVVLAAVCVVIAALLATVNAVTKDRIAELKAAAQKTAVFNVFPGADDSTVCEENETENDVYLVFREGKLLGYAARVLPKGFGGEIEMMVGVDAADVTTGVSIITLSETPGVGSKVNTYDFLSRFVGRDGKIAVGSGIDGISGATISSKAVAEGVREAHAIPVDLRAIAAAHGWELEEPEGAPETGPSPETEPADTQPSSGGETESGEPDGTAGEEKPFSEKGGPSGGDYPVDVTDTDDRYEYEVNTDAYSSLLAETDEPESSSGAEAPETAVKQTETTAPETDRPPKTVAPSESGDETDPAPVGGEAAGPEAGDPDADGGAGQP